MNCVTSLMKRGVELENQQVLNEVVTSVQSLKEMPYHFREVVLCFIISLYS